MTAKSKPLRFKHGNERPHAELHADNIDADGRQEPFDEEADQDVFMDHKGKDPAGLDAGP